MSNQTELTPAQAAMLPIYQARYIAIGLTTKKRSDITPAYIAKAVTAVKQLYKVAGKGDLENIYYGSYEECIAMAREIEGRKDVSSALSWGCYSAASAAYARFFVDEIGEMSISDKADVLYAIATSIGPSLLYEKAAFISTHPSSLEPDPSDASRQIPEWHDMRGLGHWIMGSEEACRKL